MRIDRTRMRPRTVLATAVAAVAIAATLAAPAAAVTTPAVNDAVQDHLDEYVRVHRTPGLALVTLADGDVRVRVHGVTGDGEPVDEDTPMRIASMSKAFTALAVLQQVDAGRFELDDPVATVLPELRMADDRYQGITVEHLLTHRSGLATTTLEYAPDPPATPAENVEQLTDARLAVAPGAETQYSNVGYAVLARLVEHASGVGFGEYLEQRVLSPLGMTASTVTDRCDVEPPGLARGFSIMGPVNAAVPEIPLACAGSGGITSTARDMTAWLRFQVGDGTSPATGERLLRTETFAAFHDVPTDATAYGYGWHRTGTESTPLIGHGGTLATFASGIEFSPVTGTGAVVLTNAAGEPMALTHNAIVAVDGGTPQSTSNPFDVFNAVVVGVAALALLGGIVVVARSRRWTERRAGTSLRGIVLRLVPLSLLTLLGATLPWLGATTLLGVTDPVVAYRIVLWLYPAVMVLGLAIFLAAGGGLTARLVRLRDATVQEATVRRAPAPHR